METTPKTLQIETEKEFSVPVQQLYDAWTGEDHLKQWWKPMGSTLERITNDIKADGAVEYYFGAPEGGKPFKVTGKYTEAEAPKKLIYSWDWYLEDEKAADEEYKLTIEFSETEGGSKIHVIQTGFKDEKELEPHEEGWKQGLDFLKQYVEGQSAVSDTQPSGTAEEGDRSGGYNSAPDQQKVGGE